MYSIYKKLQTGEEWQKYFDDEILDPDGWDRTTNEFRILKIDYRDYMDRLGKSTMSFTNSLIMRSCENDMIYRLNYQLKTFKETDIPL